MNIFQVLANLEDDDNLHLGRLLVLLRAFAGSDEKGSINGLTKLAKLDFLLRYPVLLERALEAKGVSQSSAKVEEYERRSVESSMVRFRYGPWDFRYRRFVNLLVAKGLAQINTEGRTIKISLTPAGIAVAASLSATEPFSVSSDRARLLKRYFDMGATNLMRFVYDTFPEITTLRLGEDIVYEY